MAWTKCTLDNFPTGNMALIDDSGFAYGSTVQTANPDDVAAFIAAANKALSADKDIKQASADAAAQVLTQAQASV